MIRLRVALRLPIALLITSVVGAGCRPPASAPGAGPAPSPAVAPGHDAVVPSAPAHPDTVTFVDRDTGVTTQTPFADLPESIAWVTVGGQRIAVSRVESTATSGHREIFRYGVDGALLDTTVGGP